MGPPFVEGEAFEEDETFAVDEVGADGGEVLGEVGESEVVLQDVCGVSRLPTFLDLGAVLARCLSSGYRSL